MQQQDETQQAAELRQAFLRHLPRRLEMMRKRGLRLTQHGWDINALTNLYHDVQVLAGACGRYGLLDIGEHLFSIENFLAPFANDVAVPGPAQNGLFVERLHRLEPLIEQHEQRYGDKPRENAALTVEVPTEINGYPLQVTPPPQYWTRFARAANPAPAAAPAPVVEPARSALPAAAPVPSVAQAAPPVSAAPSAAAPAPIAAPAAEAPPAAPSNAQTLKIFHLSDGNPLACEIDQKLEATGYELTILDNAAELKEMLASFAPGLIIIDAPFLADIETIGERVKALRPRLNHRLALLAFSASPELPVRLRAMRAGADAFVALPAKTDEIVQRIAELLAADSADPFRVLIVEDDRSQAIFAESILRKAGMATCMATEPLAALEQLDAFKPELILMDLYMPNCDGMELTSIIREREAFISTPIVFLSGEQDEEKHFAALNSGGDDFLSKPIRPKHLISAVTNRVQRARQLNRRARAANPRDPATGLYERAHVIDRINAALAQEQPQAGGVTYVEIDAARPIRERVGLLVYEALLGQVGAFLAGHVGARDLVARYGDTSFLVVTPDGGEDALRQFAVKLRDLAAHAAFEQEGKTFAVGLSMGICPFAAGLGDVGAMLNAAERAMVD
ncbi:MAG TPA: response regulator, partial [Rudaea sp.]